ncbi:Pentatricopeptide repeat [Dillenia turbinata]|uniref:Pentatricopeptide repeat n=1 Tax=Dillenia turbinata TaxID=194707 RepID=A0AAN8Z787_9MAGN
MQSHFINTKLIHSITTSTVIKHSKTRLAEQACLSLLQTCTSLSNLTQIQSHILKLGLHNNPLVLTKFASSSSNLNAIDYSASFIFSNTCLYDTFLFNTIIRAYSQTFQFKHKAISFYNLMLSYGILPNQFTYPFVLKACAGLLDLKLGQSVHGSVTKYGFDKDLNVQNTIIHMYCCCDGGVEIGRKIFDEMPKMDSVSWSAMIGGYVRAGRSNDAVGIFRKMQGSRVKADEITMVSVLSACSDLGALELGKWVAAYIEKEGIEMSVELFNALIDMFAKCGDVEEALRLFQNMGARNIISWTSVIVGLAMHGRGAEAIALFEEMKGAGMNPDEVVFIGLLMACSHSGLVEEGKKYYNSMMNEFGIVPKIEHYGCMVDLFCRAGLVEQALDFVQTMPIEPNSVIMRTLVNACRVHGKLELGEMYTKHLLEKEPMHDSNYVLLSNIYAKMLCWEKKTKIREIMLLQLIRKMFPSPKTLELSPPKIHENDSTTVLLDGLTQSSTVVLRYRAYPSSLSCSISMNGELLEELIRYHI